MGAGPNAGDRIRVRVTGPPEPWTRTSTDVLLELDRVTFGYGRTPVLKAVSLRVRGGQFVAIVGANGSGKTTLIRLAIGLLAPTHGSVRLFGRPATSLHDRSQLGYVPQRAVAASRLPVSVEEVVRTGLVGRLGVFGRVTSDDRARVDHVLDLLSLTSMRRRRLSRLSGGQQQRVLLARALVTTPHLLVLDEPTTGVDTEARSVLRETLEHLVAVEGMGVIYVSHDPEGFSGLASMVVEVRDGQLVRRSGPGHRAATEAVG